MGRPQGVRSGLPCAANSWLHAQGYLTLGHSIRVDCWRRHGAALRHNWRGWTGKSYKMSDGEGGCGGLEMTSTKTRIEVSTTALSTRAIAAKSLHHCLPHFSR